MGTLESQPRRYHDAPRALRRAPSGSRRMPRRVARLRAAAAVDLVAAAHRLGAQDACRRWPRALARASMQSARVRASMRHASMSGPEREPSMRCRASVRGVSSRAAHAGYTGWGRGGHATVTTITTGALPPAPPAHWAERCQHAACSERRESVCARTRGLRTSHGSVVHPNVRSVCTVR